ncbi:MAG: choice-of-anchor D domain-containing protein [Treponema sp.]|jgi:hypothetical protein|nr:choice-of-anchor D domain-containing protein [Treponema sp.]
MLKRMMLTFFVIFTILGCEQPTNETIKEVTTVNNIPIIWKGSLTDVPSDPSVGWAYYNTVQKTAFIWDGDSWEILARDGTDGQNGTNGANGVGIIWKGESSSAPSNPQLNWAYYNNTDGNAYIYNGNAWGLLAKAGRNGESGILLWLGTFPAAPSNPSPGTAYHNSLLGISYIWDGDSWEILARDGTDGQNGTNGANGAGIVWKGALPVSPSNPQLNWAYYNTGDNTSYIWDADSWEILAESGSSTIMVSITWKGSLPAAPINPQIGWMYYNTIAGKSYVWDGTSWNIVAQDGQNGQDGTSPIGFLIIWKGGLSSAPASPQQGWAYYNTSQKKSYIWDGGSWQILAQDGADGSGSGNSGVSSSGKIAIYKNGSEISVYEIPTIDAGVSASVEFEIRNIGSSVLYLTGDPVVELLYTNVNAITSRGITIDTSQTLTTIQPGSSTIFTVNYTPQGGDTKTYCSILIRSSDASKAPFYFYIYRSARAPVMGIALNVNSTSYQAILYYYSLYLADPGTYSVYGNYMFDTVNFGNVVTGSSVNTTSITISNVYGTMITTLNLTGTPPIQISGPDADCFSVVQPSVSSLAPSTTNSTAQITFTPLTPGVKTATITIPNNTVEAPNFSFTVTGTGLPVPVPGLNFTMTVDGTTYTEYPSGNLHFTSANFGSSPISRIKASSITIRNSGGGTTGSTLKLTGNPAIQVSGPDADCFTVIQPSSINISANSSTSASIRFAPTSTGTKTATITMPNNSPDGPDFSFTVTGTGTAAVPMMYISLAVNSNTYTEYPYQYAQSPSGSYTFSAVNFGDTDLGESITASLIIRNNAENNTGAVFNLTGSPPIQISGSGASSFSVIQPQVVSLAGDSNTSARIIFTPVSSGQKTATVTIPNNSPEKPDFSFTVTGDVITYPTYPVLPWPKVYDGNLGSDGITCSLTDSQGNLYFIGYGYNLVSSSSYYDWWIKKFDSNGNEILSGWDKKISTNSTSSSSSYDQPRYAIIDGANNIVISDNNYTIKFAPDGTEVYRLNTGGTLYVDNANNVFVVKSSSITKYNSAGTQAWTKSYGGTLKIDSANGILVYSGSSLRYLTSTGTESWTKTVTGFTINDAVIDSSNNIYIAGYGTDLVNVASGQDVWLKKYNSAGTEITTGWDKKIDWGYNTGEYARQIFTYSSYIFVTGYGSNLYSVGSGGDGWIKQYTLDGQELSTWNKILDTDSEVNLLKIDTGGNLYFNSGSSTSAIIRKYSITNVLLNTIQYNRYFTFTSQYGYTSSSRYVSSPVLMFDLSGNLYVAGYSSSSIMTSSSGYDWVIRKFDSAGVEQ